MRYTFLVALREYVENAKTKGFWIGIFMLPLMIAVGIGVTTLLAQSEPSRHFVVVDQSGAFADAIEQSLDLAHQRNVLQALRQYVQENSRAARRPDVDLAAIPADGNQGDQAAALAAFTAAGGKDAFLSRARSMLDENAPAFEEPSRPFVPVDLPDEIDNDASMEEILAKLRPYLLGERRVAVDGREVPLFAALLVSPDALDEAMRGGTVRSGGNGAIQYWSTNLAVDNLPNRIRDALNDEIRRRLYIDRGVDASTVRDIEETRVRLGAFDPGKAEGEETVSVADRIVQNAPVAFVYMLWISIFSVMQMLLYNTIEEKSNRIAEVLLSSVTPGEIMMGKLIGIAAIGFTMVAAWLAAALGGLQAYRGEGAQVVAQALDAVWASGLVPVFLLCFLFGYLIYAGVHYCPVNGDGGDCNALMMW